MLDVSEASTPRKEWDERKGMSSRRANFNFNSNKQLFTKRNQFLLNLADQVCTVKYTIKCNLHINYYRNHFMLPHILYFTKQITFNQSYNYNFNIDCISCCALQNMFFKEKVLKTPLTV